MRIKVWYNPKCSKCRQLKALLAERGVEVEYRHYLEQPPTMDELQKLQTKLVDPEVEKMIRSKEDVFSEQNLAQADAAARLHAICENPCLINRPIVETEVAAIVARPPEKALELL